MFSSYIYLLKYIKYVTDLNKYMFNNFIFLHIYKTIYLKYVYIRVRVLGERISSPPGHVIVRGLLPGHGL